MNKEKKPKYKVGDVVCYNDIDGNVDTFKIESVEKECVCEKGKEFCDYLYYSEIGRFIYEDDIIGFYENETVISAAIHFDDGKEYTHQKIYGVKTGFVIGVFRHPYVLDILPLNPNFKKHYEDGELPEFPLECGDYKVTQGFMTSLGRFVDRKEAFSIALKAEQITLKNGVAGELFSEDLYPRQKYNYKGEETKDGVY